MTADAPASAMIFNPKESSSQTPKMMLTISFAALAHKAMEMPASAVADVKTAR